MNQVTLGFSLLFLFVVRSMRVNARNACDDKPIQKKNENQKKYYDNGWNWESKKAIKLFLDPSSKFVDEIKNKNAQCRLSVVRIYEFWSLSTSKKNCLYIEYIGDSIDEPLINILPLWPNNCSCEKIFANQCWASLGYRKKE